MRYSLRQLQIFRAVAQDLSYTRAAEVLNLTQPAVFTQVRHLENQIGSPLIERIGKRLYLTATGAAVQAAARTVLQEIDRLDMELAELQGMVRGRLRLAVVSTAKYDIPARLGVFCAAHPGIDVALTVTNREAVLARFAANEDDLYVLGTPPDHLGAEALRFAHNPLVLVAPPDHPLAAQPGLSVDQVARWPFLMREPGSGTRMATEAFFAARGAALAVRMELGANEAIKQAVMAGLGLAVLSRGTVELELRHGLLVMLDLAGMPLQRHWFVAWPAGKRLSVAARAFVEVLTGPLAAAPVAGQSQG